MELRPATFADLPALSRLDRHIRGEELKNLTRQNRVWLAEENDRHFYTKPGYQAVGGFTPYHEPYELLFSKKLSCFLRQRCLPGAENSGRKHESCASSR